MKLNRIVVHGAKARNKLAAGADYLAQCVGLTLGPFGQNFFLDKGNKVTNDGAKIAQEIVLKDEIENRGAIALREVAMKTNDQVGDGTTTSIVLAQAIYKAASKKLADKDSGRIGGTPPAELVRQIERECNEVIEKLQEKAEPITTKEQLVHSAMVSVEDAELAKLIGETQWELGPEGYVLAEETIEKTCSAERLQGIRTDNGLGATMVMNNQEKQQLEVENVHTILTSHTIKSLADIIDVLESLEKSKSLGVTIVARAFTSDAIKQCATSSNTPGGLKIYPINAPYVDQAEIFKDLQAVLGGTYYHDEASDLKDMQLTDVGLAKKVIARRWDSTFIGMSTPEAQTRIDKRVKELEEKLSGVNSDFEVRNLKSRIAQLKNGFGLVNVGSASDLERKRLYDKAEDAVQAVRAAFQEGVVPGAGIAFRDIALELPDEYILKIPLQEIYKQISSSAPKDWVVEPWVQDPVKVLRIALTNACSAAATFATAGGVVTAENQKPRMVQEVDNNEETE